MPYLLLKGAALLAVAAGIAGGHTLTEGHAASVQSTAKIYVVRSGDTLGGIAREFCGRTDAYPSLARASGISNPNVIQVGQRVVLACGGNTSSSGSSSGSSSSTVSITGSSYAAGSSNIPATSRWYSFAGMERIWIAAGGSPSTAYHAACIASHESSGRSWVVSPTDDWGLWQIHDGGYMMLDPIANAKQAIAISGNGANWSQWSVRNMC